MIGVIAKLCGVIMVVLLRLYQLFLSPIFPPSCRYAPTCSEYMIDAVKIHGPLKGVALGLYRLMRCNPLFGSGFDPVRNPDIISQIKQCKKSVTMPIQLGEKHKHAAMLKNRNR